LRRNSGATGSRYAFDSLCAQQRENSVKLAKILGYESVDQFLLAYGFESIKGPAVYEIRKKYSKVDVEKVKKLLEIKRDNYNRLVK